VIGSDFEPDESIPNQSFLKSTLMSLSRVSLGLFKLSLSVRIFSNFQDIFISSSLTKHYKRDKTEEG
jgi:hypothetical protein